MSFNIRATIKVLGILTLIEGLFMLPALAVSLYFNEWHSGSAFLTTSMFCISIGFVILTQMKSDKINLKAREGYFITLISWLYCSLIGAIPIYFCGQDFPLISCIFESVAGFTTTGCSVLDITLVPKSILIWRAISHWLGGMGILVLLIAIFPLWGINNKSIALAEAPGTSTSTLGANYSNIGKFLYMTYFIMSTMEFFILVAGPMDWYNAILTTCSSISTAGLIILPEYAWMYKLEFVRMVVLIFTILSAMNFTVYLLVASKKWKEILKNIELRVFFALIISSTVLISLSLKFYGAYSSLWQAFKDSLCQVVSFISTSGFYVCDYTTWPSFAITILILLLFIGGCSYSTSGSLKVFRFLVLFKFIKRGVLRQIHPNMVKAVMLDDTTPVSSKVASSISMHTLLYFVTLLCGCVLLSLNNFDMETTFTTAIGIFSNTGIALGASGSSGYFGMFNQFSQFVMSILMIAGRLEMYALIIVFAKSFWQPDKTTTI